VIGGKKNCVFVLCTIASSGDNRTDDIRLSTERAIRFAVWMWPVSVRSSLHVPACLVPVELETAVYSTVPPSLHAMLHRWVVSHDGMHSQAMYGVRPFTSREYRRVRARDDGRRKTTACTVHYVRHRRADQASS
jgi:hypothetical protein